MIAALMPGHSRAASEDRGALVGKICGDAAAMGDAGRALTGIAANGSVDDRAWAATRAILIDLAVS